MVLKVNRGVIPNEINANGLLGWVTILMKLECLKLLFWEPFLFCGSGKWVYLKACGALLRFGGTWYTIVSFLGCSVRCGISEICGPSFNPTVGNAVSGRKMSF